MTEALNDKTNKSPISVNIYNFRQCSVEYSWQLTFLSPQTFCLHSLCTSVKYLETFLHLYVADVYCVES